MGKFRRISYNFRRTVSGGNINRIIARMKYKGVKMLPKQFQRPLILFFALLGLWGYIQLLIRITESKYLILVINWIASGVKVITDTAGVGVTSLLFIILIAWGVFRYITDISEDKKGSATPGVYRTINMYITLMYVVVTVLAIIPYLIPYMQS